VNGLIKWCFVASIVCAMPEFLVDPEFDDPSAWVFNHGAFPGKQYGDVTGGQLVISMPANDPWSETIQEARSDGADPTPANGYPTTGKTYTVVVDIESVSTLQSGQQAYIEFGDKAEGRVWTPSDGAGVFETTFSPTASLNLVIYVANSNATYDFDLVINSISIVDSSISNNTEIGLERNFQMIRRWKRAF